MEKPVTTFAARLKDLMAKRQLNNVDIARVTGKNISNISRWLDGKYEPKQDVIYILSRHYGVDPAWLMGYDIAPEDDTQIPNKETIITALQNGVFTKDQLNDILFAVVEAMK